MVEEESRLRKTIRLPSAAYHEPGSSWLVTLVTADRNPCLSDPCLGGAILAMLTDDASSRGIELHLACLMPDHVHLLVSVTTGDVVSAVGALKSRSTKVFRGFGHPGPLWQRSFFDQGLRGEKAFEEAVRYILQNPVVAGLVDGWEEYDLIGGSLAGRP